MRKIVIAIILGTFLLVGNGFAQSVNATKKVEANQPNIEQSVSVNEEQNINSTNDLKKKSDTNNIKKEKSKQEDVSENEEGEETEYILGKELPLWSIIPFIGILLSIALFPLIFPKFWHHHFGKVAAFWALVFALPFLFVYKGVAFHEILHIYLIDYIPFIILLWSLFTVAGGILVKGSLEGTPEMNLMMLLIGAFMASWIGTTGAAMVLIRPVLRANRDRKYKTHIVVFFIFLVANIGGSLTPLGDPPLFLGFLHGVPFFWTFHIFSEMATTAGILLVILYIMDRYYYAKEDPAVRIKQGKMNIKILGAHNFIFLLGIIGGVLLSGFWHAGDFTILGVKLHIQNEVRDLILIIMGLLSLYTTKKEIREENEFSWFPIQEVAYLFAGIFMTIIPALSILKAGTDGALAFLINSVKEPAHYFWVTGTLSSFLDNAPTYLTFLNTALGQFFPGVPEKIAIHNLIAHQNLYLKAISSGAVFMGANTYIGNAPNFMVKSIAEENGIDMPSFFGYIFKYSLIFLIPTFILVTFIFF
ncbi:Na+/H+ antiporter, NhaD family [Thermotomaculum hydrothermale]|uniref:Na+/H+ antiporter, NhaD family n=1 Tax=Thermotomaculum hydrothermale TaxID=981385 RepID=A0A7R6PEL8_9BACT|nr:sodium:proton antiporter [Thermotomaculum hydrothermale]BBB32268.1 Na+/H+ antiporter, NhaD family [Thermotomaculum hydrothermale]